MILDTTAIIDLLKGNTSISEKIKELERKNVSFSTTSVSIFEIWQGTSDIVDERRLEKIISLLDSLNVFNFDSSAAKVAGAIHSSLKKLGTMIDPEDSMIAGIAKINNEVILTRNKKHFQRIQNLKIEFY